MWLNIASRLAQVAISSKVRCSPFAAMRFSWQFESSKATRDSLEMPFLCISITESSQLRLRRLVICLNGIPFLATDEQHRNKEDAQDTRFRVSQRLPNRFRLPLARLPPSTLGHQKTHVIFINKMEW